MVMYWSPFWFGDPRIGLGILCDSYPHFGSGIPVLVWGCLDPHFGLEIPESFRGFIWSSTSPFCFGDPRFGMGIWGSPFWFGDPRIGLGIHLTRIPILLWGSPFWYRDSGIPVLVWGFPIRFGDPRIGSGILAMCIPISIRWSLFWFGDSWTNMGIPKLKWGVPVLILSHSVQRCDSIYIYRSNINIT